MNILFILNYFRSRLIITKLSLNSFFEFNSIQSQVIFIINSTQFKLSYFELNSTQFIKNLNLTSRNLRIETYNHIFT